MCGQRRSWWVMVQKRCCTVSDPYLSLSTFGPPNLPMDVETHAQRTNVKEDLTKS